MLSDPGVNIPGLFTEATSVQPTEQMTELLISLPIDAEAQAPGVVDQTFPVDATTQATLLPALEAAQPSLTALHSPQSAPASEAEQAPVVELAVTVEKAAAEMPVGRVDKLGVEFRTS